MESSGMPANEDIHPTARRMRVRRQKKVLAALPAVLYVLTSLLCGLHIHSSSLRLRMSADRKSVV